MGITDYFDGYLARANGTVSKLGVFLDPIADKIMVAAVILMLIATRDITGLNIIAAIIILLREIAVSGLREFLADLRVSVPVSKLAKWKTALQLIALGARSEEHTSELQSLMRSTYAVFCLKKKNIHIK